MGNVQYAKDIYAAFGRGDIPAVLARFHPQIEWREAEGNPYQPDGAAWVGPQAVLEKLFLRLGSEWEGFTVTVRTLHDAGDHVVMEGRYTGRYKPSDRRIDAQVCHVLSFRDGKLSSFQQYVDTGQLQTAMATEAGRPGA
jgi:ketosteroid isomerase-like protein